MISNKYTKVKHGAYCEFEGKKDYGIASGNAIPNELIEEVMQDVPLKIPCMILNFKFRLMIYPFQGLEYNGRAYKNHIVYGARREIATKESIGALVIHEIGHMLMYKAFNCTYEEHLPFLKKYCELRNIPHKDSKNWYKRPAERFAEDFRFLFGKEYMKNDMAKMYKGIGKPKVEIRDYMLKLYRGIISEGAGKMEIAQVTSEWAKDGKQFVTDNKISDGTKPKDNITREEQWTMMERYHTEVVLPLLEKK